MAYFVIEPTAYFIITTVTYPTTQPLKIKINGVDRTETIWPLSAIEIENVITKQIDTARLPVKNGGGFGLADLQEVIISSPDEATRYFAGFIETKEEIAQGVQLDYMLACVDYTWLLDHPAALVNQEYESQDDSAIIDAFMDAACPDVEDTTYVSTVRASLERQRYPRMTPREVLEKLAGISGADWYVDYGPGPGSQKAYLHYFSTEENAAPYYLSDSPDLSDSFPYENLREKSSAPWANLIEVLGGDYLSSDQTLYLANDNVQTKIPLPHRSSAPTGQSSIQVWRNDGTDPSPSWTALTVGTGYLHDIADYDVLHFFQEKYLEFATAPPNLTKAVKVSCRYWIPLRQRVRDYVSYANYGRWMAGVIIDKDITDKDSGKKRGKVELAKRAATQTAYTLTVREPGLKAGQYIRLVNSKRGIDDYFLIQRVVTRFIGGGYATFDLELGLYAPDLVDIIVGLKRLEKADWTEGEVLDELLDVMESMDISDAASYTERGPTYYWSPHTPSSEEAVWDFFAWG